jgi:hypothetical protein
MHFFGLPIPLSSIVPSTLHPTSLVMLTVTKAKRMMRTLLLLLSALSLLPLSTVSALGSIKIVGISGTGTQLLPKSYVQSFHRWQLDGEGNLSKRQKKETGDLSTVSSASLIRPTLDFLVKDGVPVYVMAGLEIRENVDSPTSYPVLAQQWTTFGMAVEPNFRVSVYAGSADGTDDCIANVGSEEIKIVVERLGFLLSQSTTADLTEGFHILSVPVTSDWILLSTTGDEEAEIITCLATAEPDARELLTMDPDLVEMTVTSVLQVQLDKVCSN